MSMMEGHRSGKTMYSIPLGMAGRALSLHTDSKRVAQLAAGFFPSGGMQPTDPPRAALTMLVSKRRVGPWTAAAFPIFRGRSEYVHADYGPDGSVWFDLNERAVLGVVSDDLIANEELFRRAVLAVIAGILAPSLGLIGLHAGCVVRNGNAVLLAAASGVGKSTMSLALALRGWSLLSDDWTFVAMTPTGLQAWGMWTSLKLLPDAVRYFPGLATQSPAPALNGEMSYEIDPWAFFRIGRAIDAKLTALILLERDPGDCIASGCRFENCGPEETRTALLQEVEEQPKEICVESDCLPSLLERLCALPSFRARVSGHPAAIAADLDSFLMEQVCE